MFFELPFGIVIDLSFWQVFLDSSLTEQVRMLVALGAWVVLAFVFIKTGVELWTDYRQSTKGTKGWKWVVLAVDIPAMFIQSPKAVEQIFAHLSGALGHSTVGDKFWMGKKQKYFSFEVISIEGYIQFLVRTEAEFRDLIEAAIYAQYTEAEITEVEDYVENIPDKFPHSDYDVLGVEFKLSEKAAYPIRTYADFEYKISKDSVFSDPMAAILENFTRIGHGENLWMQLIVEPVGSHWKEEGIELAKELLAGGGHGHGHGGEFNPLGWVAGFLQAILQEMINILHWNFEAHESHEEHAEEAGEVTPGTKKTVEAIEDKIAKIGFKSKLRVLYAARKEVYSPNRCIDGFVGAMNQFHTQNKNALVPYMATHAHYDNKHKKSNALKNTFTKVFKKRKMKWKKCDGYILNIEELATVWHFPLPFVKAPLMSKAGAKRAEPPTGLPVELMESPLRRIGQGDSSHESAAAESEPNESSTPENLPYG